MFSRFGLIALILLLYIYLTSVDSDKTFGYRAKKVCSKCCNDLKKNDLKIKINKKSKEKRFF
jgi:hypothetical protein